MVSLAESNYPITETERLAVIWALGKFQPYFNQLKIKIITDHRALTSGRNLSASMIRWTLRVNEFNVVIENRPGASNTVAECLSRAPRQEAQVSEVAECSLLTFWVIQPR